MNAFLAAVINPFDQTLPRRRPVSLELKQWIFLMSAILVVSILVLIWVWLTAKSRRRAARREERRKRREGFARQAEAGDKPERRRGRRRRHHRPRNPTLAETGGLPPVRDGDQPPQIQPH